MRGPSLLSNLSRNNRARLLARLALLAVLPSLCAFISAAQNRSQLTGVVRNAAGSAVGGVGIVVTNQGTSGTGQRHGPPDGTYSLRLRPGPYLLTVGASYRRALQRE